MAEQHYQEYEAYLQKLADGNVTNGVLYEPRAYFDMIPLGASPEQFFGHPEVFRNGEEFPVIITHMTATLSLLDQDAASVNDERLVQAVGMYMKFHEQYYMNPPQTFEVVIGGAFTGVQLSAPLPTWINTQVATSDVTNRGATSWRLPRPNILSVRDTLRVEVMTPYPVNGTRYVTVGFMGIGILSRQPYFLSGTAEIEGAGTTLQIDTEQFVNDGVEPILLTDMTCNVQPESGDPNAIPDARSIFLRVRQIGNGTGADWFQSPLNFIVPGTGVTLPTSMCGVSNLATKNGRAVVHEFPKAVIWEPGAGLDIAVQSLDARPEAMSVQVALLGYIAVQ